jgi:hypothetical protein
MVSGGPRHTPQRYEGRFFGRRVNCEQVPLLPAWIVARMLCDPRKIPYLLVWRSRSDGMAREVARIAPHCESEGLGGLDWTFAVEVKRPDGTRNFLRTVLRVTPRNGGRTLFLRCPYCDVPRRGLYPWIPWGRYTTSVTRSSWQCRACAGLRYASEGGALVHRGRGALFRLLEDAYGPARSPRPEPWYPDVFTSPEEAMEAGVCVLGGHKEDGTASFCPAQRRHGG